MTVHDPMFVLATISFSPAMKTPTVTRLNNVRNGQD